MSHSSHSARLMRCAAIAVFLAAAPFTALAEEGDTGLNDTGQTRFYDATAHAPGGEPPNFPGQDARFGRDAANADGVLVKTGGGDAGFDFTKLGADGQPLAIQDQPWARDGNGFDNGSEAAGTRWSCVRDNVTGLTWEVKTYRPTPDLHDRQWTYGWYSSLARPDGTANGNNGGEAGGANRGTCLDKYHPDDNPSGTYCDTAGFVAAVNAVGLCGANDWRMPSAQELHGLVHFGRHWPAIDVSHFPNTPGDFGNPQISVPNVTWTGSPSAHSSSYAHSVYFDHGYLAIDNFKTYSASVRLVRTTP